MAKKKHQCVPDGRTYRFKTWEDASKACSDLKKAVENVECTIEGNQKDGYYVCIKNVVTGITRTMTNPQCSMPETR